MSHPAPTLLAWRNAVFVFFTLSGLSFATWVSRLPTVRDELRLDTAAVGLIILGLSIGSIVGLVASPHLRAALGPRGGILFSLTLNALGLIGIGVASTLVPSPVLATISLAVLGFGNGSLDVMMNLEGAGAERAIGRTLLPLMHAFFSLGTVLGAGIGAGASALGVPVFWHLLIMGVLIVGTTAFFVPRIPASAAEAAAISAVSAPASSVTPAPTPSGTPAPAGAPAPAGTSAPSGTPAPAGTPAGPRPTLTTRLRTGLAVWADRRLLLIGVVMLGMAFAEGSANDWLALATVDGHHQDNTTGAIVFGIFVAAMTLGRVVGGPLLDRYGRVPVLRWSALTGAIGLLIFIFAPGLVIAIVGAVLWGLGASLGFPVGISAAADDPEKAPARVGAVAIIGYLAFLAGPPLLGFLGQQFGILNAFFVVLVLLVAATLASPAARELTGRFARQPEPQPSA